VKYTLLPLITAIQQEFNRKLWPVQQKYFIEFNTASLERGDIKTRYEAYRIMLGRAGERPVLSVNDVRRLENYEPVQGGDDMSPIGQQTEDGLPNRQKGEE
jgi:phage portal protein BeeE